MKLLVLTLIITGCLFIFLLFVVGSDYKGKGGECGKGLAACLSECPKESWWQESSCIVSCAFANTGCLFGSLKLDSE